MIYQALSDIDWFEWNGVKCTEYGMHVLSQPVHIRAAERASTVSIPGRSGSLTLFEGTDQNPKLDTLFAIADVLGLTLDDFNDRIKDGTSSEAGEVARRFDCLDGHGKRVVRAVLDLEYERCTGTDEGKE